MNTYPPYNRRTHQLHPKRTIEQLEGKELARYVNSLVSDVEKRIEEAYEDGYETVRDEFACECDCC